MTLNDKQLEAVNHTEGPCLVLAGAGSGKTRVLTERIIKLIDDGVSPYNILAITFTNKAAKEMRVRVQNKIGDVANSIFIGTFHSFGLRILRENYDAIGYSSNITILDTDDTKSLIKRILKENSFDPADYDIKHIISKISSAKNDGISPLEFSKLFLNEHDKVIGLVYEKYLKLLKENNSVDFDDLLLKPVEIFKKRKDILEKYQERFRYILVDEYQDTNSIQYELCKMLAKKYNNIFVVGDANQSIYSWRNADYRNILNFEKDYKNAHVVLLEENYRSTNTILKAANSVIKNNNEGTKLNLWTSIGDGEKVEYIRVEDEIKESSFVINKIKELVSEGYSYSDFAVLYRTNAQSRTVEEAFVRNNIPYNIIGSYYFYNRKEIKDLIAYLNLIYNTNDSVSLERVINTPKRGIGTKTIDNIREKANMNDISLFDAIDSGKELEFKKLILELIEDSKTMNLSDLIEDVLVKTGLRREYELDKSIESDTKVENLNEFKSLAVNFEDNGIYDLSTFLENIMLVSDKGQYAEDDNNVNIMTLHSAKGLEFNIVFILGMEEGIFPHSRSFESAKELEEERRLCYVGITRAKKKLYLLSARTRTLYGRTSGTIESRFIKEIDPTLINIKNESVKKDENKKVSNMYSNKTVDGLKAGDTVIHTIFGEGVIIKISGDIATIAFKYGVGIKSIAANHKYLSKK
ncbi:aTP-dependent DNA helicase PcrA [Clostridium sp. CAG:524]|jgi:DNA helicase-2/ATP-dependent DNA helicase PcrA|nr:aTP-dependent DNA helicase PcrA [Clostridium sp. CAG:524]